MVQVDEDNVGLLAEGATEEVVTEEELYDDAMDKVQKTMSGEVVEPEPVEPEPVEPAETEEKEKLRETRARQEGHQEKMKSEISELQQLREEVLAGSAENSRLQQQLNTLKKKTMPKMRPKVFDDSWAEMKEEFPDVNFQRVEDRFSRQEDQIEILTRRGKSDDVRRKKADDAKLDREIRKKYSNFEEIVNSEEFLTWQGALPPEEQKNVLTANDFKKIDGILKTFFGATGYKSQGAQEAESTDPEETTVSRRQAASLGVDSKQPAVPVTGGADGVNEDAIYDEVYKKMGIK